MKTIKIKYFTYLFLAAFFIAGCSKLLVEKPRSVFTPEFFNTDQGVAGGVNFLYLTMRYIWGNGYFYNANQTGTDEATYAQSADDNFKVMDISGQGNINPSNSRADVIWDRAFSAINTASGVIKNGTEAGASTSLIAEAKFFRAFYYFNLVQTFGGVPLDLGGGELEFNDKPTKLSVRNTVPEVYTKGVFPDLIDATNELPDVGRVTGGVTKTTAQLYLAKAYLTYAWWLENPNNIPTFPETDRNDPDGHNAAWYFQQAYDVATNAIANPGPYGLQPTFYDVNRGDNDRNNEVLLYADHTEASEQYNGASLTYSNGGSQENFAGWMMTWNYPVVRSSSSGSDYKSDVESVARIADQRYGRPWIRMSPTIGAYVNTFADKNNDSRFDGTFTTVYRANMDANNISGSVYNANLMQVHSGDAILTFLDDEPSTSIIYPSDAGNNKIGAGTLPGRSDFVISPSGINRIVYPGLYKLGPYRTDNDGGLGQPNAASTRPFNIAKFSDLFFVAAEAAVKGANTSGVSGPYSNDGSARGLLNVIRARAGKWKWSVNGNEAKTTDNSAAMVAATPATITVDYILQESSREFYGEGRRWLDLVRTQKWNDFADTYQIGGSNYGDHTLETVSRSIVKELYLRPIPQSQMDALDFGDVDKSVYQTPYYR